MYATVLKRSYSIYYYYHYYIFFFFLQVFLFFLRFFVCGSSWGALEFSRNVYNNRSRALTTTASSVAWKKEFFSSFWCVSCALQRILPFSLFFFSSSIVGLYVIFICHHRAHRIYTRSVCSIGQECLPYRHAFQSTPTLLGPTSRHNNTQRP